MMTWQFPPARPEGQSIGVACMAPGTHKCMGGRIQGMKRGARKTDGRPANGKNPHAAALGRLGGLIGGAAAPTPHQRRMIASKAAQARWGKKRG